MPEGFLIEEEKFFSRKPRAFPRYVTESSTWPARQQKEQQVGLVLTKINSFPHISTERTNGHDDLLSNQGIRNDSCWHLSPSFWRDLISRKLTLLLVLITCWQLRKMSLSSLITIVIIIIIVYSWRGEIISKKMPKGRRERWARERGRGR